MNEDGRVEIHFNDNDKSLDEVSTGRPVQLSFLTASSRHLYFNGQDTAN